MGVYFAQKSVLEKFLLNLTFTDFQTGRQKVSKSDFQSQFSKSIFKVKNHQNHSVCLFSFENISLEK